MRRPFPSRNCDPYNGFKSDLFRLRGLLHLERHRTYRRLGYALITGCLALAGHLFGGGYF